MAARGARSPASWFTPLGEAIRDVPVGRYKVTARNAVPGETPVALNVRLRNVGEYQNSLIADFSSLLTTVQQMVLEVSRP